VRDAQGNPLAIYDVSGSVITLKEQQLYGSSRLGTWSPNLNLTAGTTTSTDLAYNVMGQKYYELTNHLGNVMATISDKRLQTGSSTPYYLPDVVTQQDYYSFGAPQPGDRTYVYLTRNAYRYGFNGKENDDDVGKGTGNQQDYGMRIYDPRVGRFFSEDPLFKNFPWYSVYQSTGDNPIKYIDLDGEEPKEKTINYGRNLVLGNANVNTLQNSKKLFNDNWMGSNGDIKNGLVYMEQIKNNMLPETKIMNIVFVTHGGYELDNNGKHTGDTNFHPDYTNDCIAITSGEIMKFLKTGTSGKTGATELFKKKDKYIGELKQMFDKMGEGGNFVFSACRVGDDPNMGKALQALSGGRINIYVTPDLVQISKGISKINELKLGRIQDNLLVFKTSHFVKGFIKYPANYGDPINTSKNLTLNPTGVALELTTPRDKVGDKPIVTP